MFEAGVFPDIAALKTLNTTGFENRKNAPIALVAEPVPDMVLDMYVWTARTIPEMTPAIAKPNTGGGAWVGFNRTILAAAKPAIAPPYVGLTWIANFTNPTRRVMWQSIGVNSVADWKGIDTPFLIPGYSSVSGGLTTNAPTFAPDFIGQTAITAPVILSSGVPTSGLWCATGLTASSWVTY